jgi:ATP-dependent DNA helicase RecQ
MSTGDGKSLCYQIPSIVRAGVGVVVCPLIALMQNQVHALKNRGVCAEYLHSGMSTAEEITVEEQLLKGKLDLIYVSPERLATSGFKEILTHLYENDGIALFAIDEAHCISHWGHHFRPNYRKVSMLSKRFPDVPRIAVTATADGRTRQDIVEQLQLEDAKTFVSSFDRPNLAHTVVIQGDQRQQLLNFLKEHEGQAGIIYCQRRKTVEEISRWLVSKDIKAAPYHADLPDDVRSSNLQRFIQKRGIVMVATEAFGMGIDKPNVRFVALLGMPKSLEDYYQQVGRAGRDGESAQAWMCFSGSDVTVHRRHINDSNDSLPQKEVKSAKLNAAFAWAQSHSCRRVGLLKYFGEVAEACGLCDNCIDVPKVENGRVVRWEPTRETVRALFFNDPNTVKLRKLRAWRNDRAIENRVPVFKILPDSALNRLLDCDLATIEDLMKVRGFGQQIASRYGSDILRILND